MTRENDIDIARNVIRIEREALEQLEAGLDTAIEQAAASPAISARRLPPAWRRPARPPSSCIRLRPAMATSA